MNGKQLNVSIFIGPTFYLRLTHQVAKKAFSRGTGSVTTLTKQPLGGRSAGGGLRIGEMERDALLSHGCSLFLKESMVERADKYHVWISNKSGLMSIVNPDKHIYKDFSVDKIKYVVENNLPTKDIMEISDADYHKIVVPYAFKLFIQELQVMNVGSRMITSETHKQWIDITNHTNNLIYKINDTKNNITRKKVRKIHKLFVNFIIL